MAMTLRVSVIICTRNRDQSLRRTLESLRRLEIVPGTRWEVIVVDNGSKDTTADVVESFTGVLPVRRVLEDVPGLSVARNKGVSEAKGEFIVWTDDDVEVDKGWLSAYLKAFDRWSGAAMFGGTSFPVLEQPAAPWFRGLQPGCIC
jgi:glycosyltransferase involved in cell wall biosynthesis